MRKISASWHCPNEIFSNPHCVQVAKIWWIWCFWKAILSFLQKHDIEKVFNKDTICRCNWPKCAKILIRASLYTSIFYVLAWKINILKVFSHSICWFSIHGNLRNLYPSLNEQKIFNFAKNVFIMNFSSRGGAI